MSEFSVICNNENDTAFVATTLAPYLHPGDAVMLKGGLGGGKTTFVKALVAALHSDAHVTSPTFSLADFYPTEAGTVLHMDTYRLSSIAEYRDLGLSDYTPESISLVEWGEKVENDFPDSLSISFEFESVSETSRSLTFSSKVDRWVPVIAELQSQLHELIQT